MSTSQNTNESTIGRIVDMGLDEFNKELKKQKVNVGVANNLKLLLISEYNKLSRMKDDIIKNASVNDETKVKDAVNGIYAELFKIEGKVLHLNKYINNLINVN